MFTMIRLKFLISLICVMSIIPFASSQKTIRIGDIIHNESLKHQKKDLLTGCRNKLPFANAFYINEESDTIFAIELLFFSEYEPSGYFSYWTNHSLYSARQDESGEYAFKIKNENFFPRWLMENVQTWNTDSLSSLGAPIIPHNEEIAGTYYAYRIIIDKGNISVDSMTFYPSKRKIPKSEEESDELWYRWIGEDLSDDDDE